MKINNTIIAFLLVLFILPINMAAQDKLKGNKIVITEDRNISDFSKIVVKDKIDVIITQGSDKSVSVETDENLQFAVLTEVQGEILTIRLSKKIIKKKVLKVYISIDDFIDEISATDKSEVTGDGTLNLDQVEINAEGDSNISLDIKCDYFTLQNNQSANVNITVNTIEAFINGNKTGKSKINITAKNMEVVSQGNSSVELIGICTDLLVNAENKSNFKASALECDDVVVNASDNSDVHVNSKNSILISAINSGEIYIYNSPKITIEKFTDKAVLRKK